MDTINFADNLQKYFDSEILSDVTIDFGGCKIKAHKIILCQGSDYFKASLTGKFKEAETSVTHLHDDPELASERLLEHLYDHTWKLQNLRYLAQTPSPAEIYVDAYVVGQKYLVPSFTNVALQHLRTVFGELPKTDRHAAVFIHLVHYVYSTHPEAAIDLRKVLIEHFATHVSSVGGKDEVEWKALMMEEAEFAWEAMEGCRAHAMHARPGIEIPRRILYGLELEDWVVRAWHGCDKAFTDTEHLTH